MKSILILSAAIAILAPMPFAQYATDFESLNASAAGVLLTDATTVTIVGTTACGALPAASQDCYYLPAATTAPFSVFTYAGNPLGISANPLGGCKFVGCQGVTGTPLGRAQREINTIGMTTCTLRADVCVKYNGTAVTAPQNAASVSFQPSAAAGTTPASKYMILLATWANAAGSAWNAIYVSASAPGASTTLNQTPSNPAFLNRPANVWNRWEVDVDFSTMQIIQLRITDLTTGVTDIENPPAPVHLIGPATAPNPIAYRLFAGNLGNVLAADNVCIDVTGVCPGLPALPVAAQYQVNGPGAALDINGILASPWCKALSTHPAGSQVNVNLTDTGPGSLGAEIAFHVGSLVSASGGGIAVPGLGIINVDLVNPTLGFFFGGSAPLFSPVPPGLISFGAPPGPFTLSIQMVTIVPGSPTGFGLSQGGEMLFP